MFAVIETGGKQYLVKKGDKIKIEKLNAEVDSEVSFDKVLLTSEEDGKNTKIGTPYLVGTQVVAKVLENSRSKKIRVIKYKRKVRYKRANGHRQHYTKVLIENIK
ncbi:MAG: 50S ribosomal protein L21 [Patescibacteria group bacterium]